VEECKLCGQEVGNLFEHLRIDHLIRSPEDYESELAKVEAVKARQRSFSDFIEALNEKKAKGLITGEDWRRLARDWLREHPT
jgi:hypothetical protein